MGGGIYNRHSSSVLKLVDSDVHHNDAGYKGGGITNEVDGLVVISRTVLEANVAGTFGGGIRMESSFRSGTLSIQESTLSRNTAQYGGAIYAAGGTTTVNNSTLSGNSVSHDGGGISLFNATIANNRLSRPAGQIYPARGGGVFITTTAIITAQNTLIGDNARANGLITPVPDDCFVSPTTSLHSLGYSLIETSNNCFISGTTVGNITGQDPLLDALQNNGSSAQTQVPMAGSPAIDHGDDAACSSLDQRGFHRPIGLSCDIGAVEVGLYAYLPLIRR